MREITALRQMLAHAARHSPYYRDQAWAARLRDGFEVTFGDLPITEKDAVRNQTAAFYSSIVPSEEGRVIEKFTSGSTGIALRILKTARHFAVNAEENKRLKTGWGFDRHRRYVRATNPKSAAMEGRIEEQAGHDGSTTWTIHTFNSKTVGELLRSTRATYFSSRASVVKGVLLDNPDLTLLRLISTVGESLPPDLDELIARIPGCLHFDLYGAVETGAIAGLCKRCGRYHVAHHQLLLEVLDDDGKPVAPGEMGRVLVTPLHNLAMPLIRYEIGDYAVRSRREACDGSGLALSTIAGRRRDLFKLPDGTKVIPYTMGRELAEIGVHQCKLVQTALSEVEVRYVPADPAAEIDRETAQHLVNRVLSPLLRATPVKVANLPIRTNGKYLMHESLI